MKQHQSGEFEGATPGRRYQDSGGHYIFLNFGLSFVPLPSVSLDLFVQIPIVKDLTGNQIDEKYRIAPRVVCVLAFLGLAIHSVLWIPRPTSGFAMYYVYARLSIEGEKLDRIYDEIYFNAKIREYGFDLQDNPKNALSAGFVYLPVAWLPPGRRASGC